MSHEPRSLVSVCVSSVGNAPDSLLPPGYIGLWPGRMGLRPGHAGLQPEHTGLWFGAHRATTVSGVLRTELDMGEHA